MKSEHQRADAIMRLGDSGVAKRVFLLGQFTSLVTIRNQQLRALALAASLKNVVGAYSNVAVIGAGFAGITCVAGLLEWTSCKVTLYDRSDTVLPVQRGCRTRFLHPFINEWPDVSAFEDDACLPLLGWRAGFANDVSAIVEQDYDEVVKDRGIFEGRPRYWFKPKDSGTVLNIRPAGQQIQIETKEGSGRTKYDYVVVATGFGDERQFRTASSPLYWENDSLDQQVRSAAVTRRKTILVSGAGDGALIDVIRSLVVDARHDQLLKLCLNNVSGKSAKKLVQLNDELAAREKELADMKVSSQFLKRFDEIDAPRLDKIIKKLRRSDRKVVLVCSEYRNPILNKDSQLINRFLLSRIQKINDRFDLDCFEIAAGRTEETADPRIAVVRSADGNERLIKADLLLLRHGPATSEHAIIRALSLNFPTANVKEYQRRVRSFQVKESTFGSEAIRISSSSRLAFRSLDQLYRLWLENQLRNNELIEQSSKVVLENREDPYDTAKAISSRAELFLAERMINNGLKEDVKTGKAFYLGAKKLLSNATRRARGLRSPRLQSFARQLDLDAAWLQTICLNFDSRAASCPKRSNALRVKAIRFARKSFDISISRFKKAISSEERSQLNLHILRVARNLVVFFQQAGQPDQATVFANVIVDRLHPSDSAQSFRANDTDIAKSHRISNQNARALVDFEELSAIRRILDHWIAKADLVRCSRLIDRLSNVFNNQKGIDSASPYHILRQMSRSLVLNSIGRNNTECETEKAKKGFALARSGFVTLGQHNSYIEDDKILARYTENTKLNELSPIVLSQFIQETASQLKPISPVKSATVLIAQPNKVNGGFNIHVRSVAHAGLSMIVGSHSDHQPSSFKSRAKLVRWFFEELQAFCSQAREIYLPHCLATLLRQSTSLAKDIGVGIDPIQTCVVLLRKEPSGVVSYARTESPFVAGVKQSQATRLKGRRYSKSQSVFHGRTSRDPLLIGFDLELPNRLKVVQASQENAGEPHYLIEGCECEVKLVVI